MNPISISSQKLDSASAAESIDAKGAATSNIPILSFCDLAPMAGCHPSANDERLDAVHAPPTSTDGVAEGGKGGEGGTPAAENADLAGSPMAAPGAHPLPGSAETLLRAIWRSPQRFHQLGVMRRDSGQFQNRSVRGIDEALEVASDQCSAGLDVYHACAEFESTLGRTAANVSWAYAFWVNVDCGVHKARDGKGHARIAQAAVELATFCRRTGLPMPTHVVDSGGGLHAY
jgi:hypothetical protein